jgi:hypothetical protein
MSINADYIAMCRSRIIEAAQQMLAGQIAYIEGTRLICSLLSDARLDRLEPPFVTFIAIDSETDYVPIGSVRDRWQAAAKERFAEQWTQAEAYAKRYGEPACSEAIDWLESNRTTF